jgi:hypothetical protein
MACHKKGLDPMTTDQFKPGDRVYVTDPGLAELRAIMRRYGHEAPPNHHGTVHEITEEGNVLIYFDSEDGPGQGSAAPYPLDEVRHLVHPDEASAR